MKELRFRVQISNEHPHCTVTIRKEKHNLTAHCTCEQGGPDTLCVHRLSILAGKAKWVISDNADEIKQVLSMVAWTDVGQAVNKVTYAQKQIREATKDRDKALEHLKMAEAAAEAARQELIRAMND
ncbi:MAG: hypothetical protein H7838_06880 [Magnetococcus sp. DMHC-8]